MVWRTRMWTVWLLSTWPDDPITPKDRKSKNCLLFFCFVLEFFTHTVQWQKPGPSPPGVLCAAEEARRGSVWLQPDLFCEWWAGCFSMQRVATLFGDYQYYFKNNMKKNKNKHKQYHWKVWLHWHIFAMNLIITSNMYQWSWARYNHRDCVEIHQYVHISIRTLKCLSKSNSKCAKYCANTVAVGWFRG